MPLGFAVSALTFVYLRDAAYLELHTFGGFLPRYLIDELVYQLFSRSFCVLSL